MWLSCLEALGGLIFGFLGFTLGMFFGTVIFDSKGIGLFCAVFGLGYFLNLASRIQEKISKNNKNKTIRKFRISRDDQEYGPYTIEELRQYLSEGSLLKSDYIYNGIEWILLGQFLERSQKAINVFQGTASNSFSREPELPELWNPKILGNLLFFIFLTPILTPIWCTIIAAKNWYALKEFDRAKEARNWIYIWLSMYIITFLIPNGIFGFILLLLIWYFRVIKSQYDVVAVGGITYYKKSWIPPLKIYLVIVGSIIITLKSIDLDGFEIDKYYEH